MWNPGYNNHAARVPFYFENETTYSIGLLRRTLETHLHLSEAGIPVTGLQNQSLSKGIRHRRVPQHRNREAAGRMPRMPECMPSARP